MTRHDRQKVVARWVREAFGEEHATSLEHRGLRLLEEALEAAQACGVEASKAHHVVEYVFGRPVGKIAQELGGVGTTLLALAETAGLDADDEESREVARVLSKPIEHFRKRDAEKDAAGLAVRKR